MKIKTLEVAGFESAIRGMRNPMNSYSKSDSYVCAPALNFDNNVSTINYIIGENDLKLAQTLISAGNEHGKFLRQIHVWANMDMPRYWWSEMDTYHYNTKNSCSTMHKLLNKQSPITIEMFEYCYEDLAFLLLVVDKLNYIRKKFLISKTQEEKDRCLLRAKRLLPEGFLQLRTVDTNYAEIRNIYFQRVKMPHRLKEEWVQTFGEWVQTLPYSKELITYQGGTK